MFQGARPGSAAFVRQRLEHGRAYGRQRGVRLRRRAEHRRRRSRRRRSVRADAARLRVRSSRAAAAAARSRSRCRVVCSPSTPPGRSARPRGHARRAATDGDRDPPALGRGRVRQRHALPRRCLDALRRALPRGRGRSSPTATDEATRSRRARALAVASSCSRSTSRWRFPSCARPASSPPTAPYVAADRGPLPRHRRLGRPARSPPTRRATPSSAARSATSSRRASATGRRSSASTARSWSPMPRGSVDGPARDERLLRPARRSTAIDDLLREGRWETGCTRGSRERGFELWCEPDARDRARQGLRPRASSSRSATTTRAPTPGMRNPELGWRRVALRARLAAARAAALLRGSRATSFAQRRHRARVRARRRR